MNDKCLSCIDKDTCELRKEATKLGNIIEHCTDWRKKFDPDDARGI